MTTSRSTMIIIGLLIAIIAVLGIMALISTPYGPGYGYDERSSDQEPIYPEIMRFPGDHTLKTEFESNGERIYYTGIDENGERIGFTGGPHWLYVHGGSCVDCHGTDGKGEIPIMMGLEIPSDITYEALVSEEHHEEEHGEEHPPYIDDTIKIAIRDGIDPSGEKMDLTMPRWQMSEQELDDIIEYLKII